MKTHLLIIILFFPLLGCLNTKRPNETPNNTLVKVEILDKRNNSKQGSWTEQTDITDSLKLLDIQREIEKMKETEKYIASPGNYGIISLECYYSNQDTEEIRIVYSIYNGVVLYTRNPSRSYKNNDLELLLTKYLREAKE